MRGYVIRRAQKKDYAELVNYNELMFPGIKHGKEYVDFWCSKDNNAIEKILIMVDQDGRILGQNIFSPMHYYYQGCIIDSAWGFDMIISEECRKENLGVPFMLKTRDAEPEMLSVGANEKALSMLLNMRFRMIGEMYRFIRIASPFSAGINFLLNKQIKPFPNSVKVNGDQYKIVLENDLKDIKIPFNPYLLEPERDIDFIKWRFYRAPNKYALYYKDNSSDYFVVRTIFKRNVPFLELVDFRCSLENKEALNSIIKAVIKVANTSKHALIYTASSLKKEDDILQHNLFLKIGRNHPILWLKSTANIKDRINNRDFVFLTLADSDGEISL